MENDFSIIDKLVAFGIDTSLATRMISSMNMMISGMTIPSSMTMYNESDRTKNIQWFARIDNMSVGPLDEKEIMSHLINKRIDKDTLVWRAGMTEWEKVEDIPEILKLIIFLPPEI